MSGQKARRSVVVADLGTGTDRNLLPLAAGLIASYCRSRPRLKDAFEIETHFMDRDAAAVFQQWNDLAVLGLSCYVWNVHASLRFARAAKERWPEAIVVIGGPSAPLFPERIGAFLREHPEVDAIVHHEGELTFAALLEAVADSSDFSTVDGISYRAANEQGFSTTPPRGRIDDLDVLPSPYLNGIFDAVLERHGARITGALLETNRGCPYQCTFCEWGNAEKNAVRRYSLDRVYAELNWIARKGMYYAYAADANFGIFYDRDLEIAQHIASLRRAHGAPGFFFVNWLKNSHTRLVALAEALREGGVETATTLAAQSYNDETLHLIKRKNLALAKRDEIREIFDRHGYPTYVELILGLPGETLESFRKGLALTLSPRLNDWGMLYLCQMIETSEMASPESRSRFAIETRFCQPGVHFHPIEQENDGEAVEMVVGTASLPAAEWQTAFIYGFFVCALYFYRLAFFITNWLRHEWGVEPAEFLDFVFDSARREPDAYPVLSGAIALLEGHSEQILAGGRLLTTVPGLGDTAFLPQEAATAFLLKREATLYEELTRLTRRFGETALLPIDDQLLREIVAYQRARVPGFSRPPDSPIEFRWNLPEYFASIVSTGDPVPLVRCPASMLVEIPDGVPPEGLALVISRMRTSMAYIPWETTSIEQGRVASA